MPSFTTLQPSSPRCTYLCFDYKTKLIQHSGLGGTTVSLLASGVVGISMFLATFPALLIIDKLGRRPLLIVGGLGMSTCLVIVGALTGKYQDTWATHSAAGWVSAVFIWLYIANFGYSWGPVSWVVISEVMPLSARASGTALAASTNWVRPRSFDKYRLPYHLR
jgi:MFS family permease